LLNLLKESNNHSFLQFYFKAGTPIRLYDPDVKEWRDVTPCEQEMYSNHLASLNYDRFSKLQDKFDYLFGIDIADRFWIVYESEESKESKEDKKTKKVGRSEARGRDCNSYNKQQLEDLALLLDIDEDDLYDDDEKLISRDELCKIIKDRLIQDKRLF
jgi:hypothetical protein